MMYVCCPGLCCTCWHGAPHPPPHRHAQSCALSLSARPAAVPANSPPALADKGGLLHWQWAFEAPSGIKALVRQELGEDNTPQVGAVWPCGGLRCTQAATGADECRAWGRQGHLCSRAGSVGTGGAQQHRGMPRLTSPPADLPPRAQGHLRLVLAPIVYNALAQREDMHTNPLFRALHRELRASTYWPLLM